MIVLGTGSAAFAGIVLLALICGGAVLLFLGLRARVHAQVALAENVHLKTLVQASPAIATIVRGDGRVEMPQRMADWLGLATPPRSLAELAGDGSGLAAEDAEALTADVTAAQRSGRGFVRALRPVGSTRAITVRGARAPGDMGSAGAVLLWAFDATDSEAEIERLSSETNRLGSAYDSLTGLIEAAPMPMWYRAPDLRLTMVNSAYVDAVEGRSAADVVARGLELVEGSGRGGPLAGAAAAREAGRPHQQVLPATIDGARRSLQIYDVPLPAGGVAGFAIDIEELERARSGAKRFAEAQRAMLDRLSAGVAQFGGDRGLVFCNQPFRRMVAMRPAGVRACARTHAGSGSVAGGPRLPDLEGGAPRLVHADRRRDRGELAPAQRHAPARRRAAAARRRAPADLRGSHGAGAAGRRARHVVAGADGDVR